MKNKYIIYCLALFMVGLMCQNSFGQELRDFVNSGGTDQQEMFFAVGEISIPFTFESETEPEPIDEVLAITFYPNPTSGIIYHKVSKNVNDPNILLHDISGRVVLQMVLGDTFIDLSNLSAGVYFINSASNEFESIKILKM